MKRIFILPILFFLSFPALADCDTLIHKLAAELYPESHLSENNVSTCKVWPYAPDKTIVVMLFDSNVKAEFDDSIYDVAVSVVDSETGEVVSQKYHRQAIADDAIYINGITIDTARYQLSEDIRAFGVRFSRRGSSSVNPYTVESLNLYTLKNGILSLVINDLSMRQFSGEWDGECTGVFSEVSRVLALDTASHNGFRDLNLQEMSTDSESTLDNGHCIDSIIDASKNNVKLVFNGNEYPISKKMQYGDNF